MDHMIYEFWASGTTSMHIMKDGAGCLRIEYQLFGFEGPGNLSVIEEIVPVLARGVRARRRLTRATN